MKNKVVIQPYGWVDAIVLEKGFVSCGRANLGVGIRLRSDPFGGAMSNNQVRQLIKILKDHLKEVDAQ